MILVAIRQITAIEKTLQQRCNNKRTRTMERCYKGRKEDWSPIPEDSRFAKESFSKENPPEKNPSLVAISP